MAQPNYTEQVDAIRAIAGELDDPPLHEALDRFRAVAVEADDLDRRFHEHYDEVKALLTQPRGLAA